MNSMYRFRPKKLVIFIIMSIMIFLFSLSHKTFVKHNGTLPLQSSISGSGGGSERKVKEVLREATMSSRTIIMTIIEKTWSRNGSIVDIFLQSFQNGEKTKHLLNHLVIVVLDFKSLQYCETIHPHCFYFQQNIPILYDDDLNKDHFSSLNYPAIDHIRNQLLLQVLHFGYNVVYTEADVIWMRNPFSLFDPKAEVTIACDSTSSNGNGNGNGKGKMTSGGIFYISANVISIDFLLLWNLINLLYPHSNNKSACEMTLYEDFKRLNVDIRYIDTEYFGGFCETNKDISNIYTMHANCCHDLENKIHDLKIFLDYSRYKELLGKGSNLELLFTAVGKTPMRCFST